MSMCFPQSVLNGEVPMAAELICSPAGLTPSAVSAPGHVDRAIRGLAGEVELQ